MSENLAETPGKHGPLVSVLIPAYNHERYVQAAIDSVAAQSWQNLELIIIDDGSKDATWQKIEEARNKTRERFARFDISRQENSGLGVTLNRLIEKAAGEYIYLIASDDIAAGNAIETMLAFLETHSDYALCVGDNAIIDDSGTICFWNTYRNIVYDKNDAVFVSHMDFIAKTNKNPNLLSDAFGSYADLLFNGNHIPNGYLIRKAIFEKTGPFLKEAPLEDYYLMLQISKHARMKFLPETLFYYRWHTTNTIKTPRMRGVYFQTLCHELRNTCPFFLNEYIRSIFAKEILINEILTDLEVKGLLLKLMPGIFIKRNSRTHKFMEKIPVLRRLLKEVKPNA